MNCDAQQQMMEIKISYKSCDDECIRTTVGMPEANFSILFWAQQSD